MVHRSDGSGTTGIWTDYLTKESPTWVAALGGASKSAGKTVAWPVGIGGKGNEGVSGAISQTTGLPRLPGKRLRDRAEPDLRAGAEQGRHVHRAVHRLDHPGRGRRDVPAEPEHQPDRRERPRTSTRSPAPRYALVYEHQTSQATAAALVNFLGWVLSAGQNLNASLYYAPLGPALQKLAVAQLKKITVNGKPVVK